LPAICRSSPTIARLFSPAKSRRRAGFAPKMSRARLPLFDEPASNADNTVLQCLRESKHGQGFSGGIMASSGELIRMMNYVDDISTTLRRIVVGSGFISPEERKKLADYMRHSDPNFTKMLEELDKEK
jgi:hypothetical protein